MNNDDPQHIGRLVRQHAQTSRLLGVDFVPVFNAVPRDLHGPAERDAGPVIEAPLRPSQVVSEPPEPPEVVVRPVSFERRPRDPADAQSKLDALRLRYEADAPHQHFVTDHHTIVFGDGDPCARLMFVGEAPGAEEDKTGIPFVGRAGQLLNKMITAMGLTRQSVYIANVLKTRPPDNATPTSDEVKLCAPYLFEQIAIIAPDAIVTLGLPATRALLDSVESMSRLRGQWAQFRPPFGPPIAVMPTYHPAFLLRSYTPENRAKVWSDLRMVMTRLGLAATGQSPA